MSDWLSPERFDVPVTGGNMRVAQWGESGPVVLGLHGITASHMSWPYVARELSGSARYTRLSPLDPVVLPGDLEDVLTV